MVGKIVKIVLALLLVHAAVRVGFTFWTFYQYEDKLQEIAQFAERRSDRQVCDEAVEAAAVQGVPITAANLTVRRGNGPAFNCEAGTSSQAPGPAQAAGKLSIYGAYTDRIQILPGYTYPWDFTPEVSVWLRVY